MKSRDLGTAVISNPTECLELMKKWEEAVCCAEISCAENGHHWFLQVFSGMEFQTGSQHNESSFDSSYICLVFITVYIVFICFYYYLFIFCFWRLTCVAPQTSPYLAVPGLEERLCGTDETFPSRSD